MFNIQTENLSVEPTKVVDKFKEIIIANNHPTSYGKFMKHACVFMLLCDVDDNPSILSILKADNKGYPWANQVALPGGHVDKEDNGPLDTAYRELNEEMGIIESNVEYIGNMGFFQTINSTEIQVFTGIWNGTDEINFDSSEIAKVLKIPVADVLKTHVDKKLYGRIPGYEELLYPYEDVVVWGATARIFHYFTEYMFFESSKIYA
ncbi:MAG: CoA pyrophosphatase [Deltaproteobacteria bacterium]|nr:CoA pyrophosphatase [Deltaproteobacteria bacterium]